MVEIKINGHHRLNPDDENPEPATEKLLKNEQKMEILKSRISYQKSIIRSMTLMIGAVCVISFVCSMYAAVIDLTTIKEAHYSQSLSPQALLYKQLLKEIDKQGDSVENVLKRYASKSQNGAEWTGNTFYSGNVKSKEDRLKHQARPAANQCDFHPVNLRFDCYPEGDASPEKCQNRGCCWRPVNERDHVPPRRNHRSKLYPSHLEKEREKERTQADKEEINREKQRTQADEEGIKREKGRTQADEERINIPYCFYPSSYFLYNASSLQYRRDGINGELRTNTESGYSGDVSLLKLEIRYETCSRVRIRISDPKFARWEPPFPVVPDHMPGCHGKEMYTVEVNSYGGLIVIRRSSTGDPLFDMRTAAPLIFSDQYIQLSTIIPSSFVYGLGQHLDGLLLDTYWRRRVLWNLDQVPIPNSNLYGSHPFYMVMEPSGSAHGVFLLNSNAIEVDLQPTPALTFRTIGGILDWYVFLGPSPDDVINQYTEVVGRPFLPPYWSLGYHQCRFGYNTLENMKKIWKRTRDAGIPFDVQWNDIDYMENQNDFTLNTGNFRHLPKFVDEIHESGMHYMIITDPGISAGEEPGKYPPFDIGVKDNLFVKNSTGDLFIGKVWNPTATVFPDFTAPNTVLYWSYFIRTFRYLLPFDGLWIDMNEPSNFWNGQQDGCPINSTLEYPSFVPSVHGGQLSYKTLCMTAKQYIGLHYDVHNLYGISEAVSTNIALKMTEGITEPFIISRSSFPGLGKYAGHWTGDVFSRWYDMWKSIGDVLTTGLHGIPMVGADICGFNGNTTVNLCNRWMQLGAFYPFSRNHNTDNGIDQDPVAMGELVVRSSRKALLQRYTLLPFLYSLFHKAHSLGTPVARPLFFKYPQDIETFAIDTQFLWGNELMIIPVLEEVARHVEAYFPHGRWYDWYSGRLITEKGREYLTIAAPLDTIPLAVAGGSILPCQTPGNTTVESRQNPFGLVVALDDEKTANGELVWRRREEKGYTRWNFRAIAHNVMATPNIINPSDEKLTLGWITILGVDSLTTVVTVNKENVKFTYSAVSKTIKIENLDVNFKKKVEVMYV